MAAGQMTAVLTLGTYLDAMACDRESYATLFGHWIGDQKFTISSSSVLRKAR
jgi:hypothetical protein